jgi:putative tricarboxylic transport membrane protein
MSLSRQRADPAGIVIAVVLMILAGVIWWDMTSLQLSSVYVVGPKAMPIALVAPFAMRGLGRFRAAEN